MRPNNIKTEEKKKKEEKLPQEIIEEKDRKEDMESIKLTPNKSEARLPSTELKNVEKEFWAHVNVGAIDFVGGSLGKYRGGITAMTISNDSRLVAIALDNGNLLIYDMIPQVRNEVEEDDIQFPLLIRIASGLKSIVIKLEFTTDSYSQLLAVFADGTARSYNVYQPGNKTIAKSKYANKDQTSTDLIFSLQERINLTPQFCYSDDEVNNHSASSGIKIEDAVFFPSYSFTGMQYSYLLNCRIGVIAKINTNLNYRGEQEEFSIYNKAIAPIAAQEEPPFPRGKNPFLKVSGGKKGLSTANNNELTRKHIDREFFAGHRYRIIMLGFVDAGVTLLSLDTKGYIYLWTYEKASFTSDTNFKPSMKMKLDLDCTKFILESSERVFPPPNEKEISSKKPDIKPEMMQRIGEFMSGIDIPDMKEKSLTSIRSEKNGTTQFFVPIGDVPEEYGIGTFVEYVFNDKDLCIKASQNKYQAQKVPATIIGAKTTKDNKYLVVHILKAHMFSVEKRENHEFIVVRLLGRRVNTMKVNLDFKQGTKIEFEVSNEVPPLNYPYLYILKGSSIMIASLITGQVVNKFDYAEVVQKQTNKSFKFDTIVSRVHTNIFLSSQKYDSPLLFKLKNDMEYEEIEGFSRFSSVFLKIWNSEDVTTMKKAISDAVNQ